MNNQTTISLTELRKNLFKIAERASRPGTYYTLTEKGRPAVVLMSAEEFESWRETLEVMQDFPYLKKDIAETDRAVKSGAYRRWTTFEDFLIEEGYILRKGEVKRKHGVPNNSKSQGKKRPAKRSGAR